MTASSAPERSQPPGAAARLCPLSVAPAVGTPEQLRDYAVPESAKWAEPIARVTSVPNRDVIGPFAAGETRPVPPGRRQLWTSHRTIDSLTYYKQCLL